MADLSFCQVEACCPIETLLDSALLHYLPEGDCPDAGGTRCSRAGGRLWCDWLVALPTHHPAPVHRAGGAGGAPRPTAARRESAAANAGGDRQGRARAPARAGRWPARGGPVPAVGG